MATEITEGYAMQSNAPVFIDNHYYATNEAAELLRVHPTTLKRWVYQGALKPYRVGKRKLVFLGSDLMALVNEDSRYRVEAGKLQTKE